MRHSTPPFRSSWLTSTTKHIPAVRILIKRRKGIWNLGQDLFPPQFLHAPPLPRLGSFPRAGGEGALTRTCCARCRNSLSALNQPQTAVAGLGAGDELEVKEPGRTKPRILQGAGEPSVTGRTRALRTLAGSGRVRQSVPDGTVYDHSVQVGSSGRQHRTPEGREPPHAPSPPQGLPCTLEVLPI